MQSTQNSDDSLVCNCVCSFCLSINRRATPVLQLSERLLNLTAFYVCSQSTQICWECKARLKNYLEFCERAERAQEVLNRVNTQQSVICTSLSRLVVSKTLLISLDPQIPDRNYRNSADDAQSLQGIQMVKIETEIVKEESEVLVNFETSTEYADDYSEPEFSNNCVKSVPAINLRLKRDDDFFGKNVSKFEGEDTAKRFNIAAEDTANGTKMENRHPHVKISSDANCSRKDDYELLIFEKFIATEDEMREYLKPMCFKNKCKVCLREFRSINNFVIHMKKYHSDCVGQHKCNVCGYGQPTEAALKLHRQQHYVLYRCLADGCRFVHKFLPSLKAHQAVHQSTQTNEDTYACHQCKRKFKNLSNVLRHIRCAHLDATKCKHCGKDFPDRKSLHQHMKLIHVDKMVVCDICGVRFASLRELQRHLILHRNLSLQKYACRICNKSFSCRFKERIHQFVHNGKPRIRCHLCKTEFIEEEARMKHLESRHGVTKEEVSKNPPSDAKRKRRRRKKGGSTKCEVCGKEFKFPSVLEYHVLTRHSDDRPFKCHICSDGFKTKPILDNHVRKHSDERAFKCDVCDKSFKYIGNLYTHKILHTGEKPFMCNICGTSFALKGNLKGHMMIHTGEKKFDCNVCGKKFPTNSCLKKHSRIH